MNNQIITDTYKFRFLDSGTEWVIDAADFNWSRSYWWKKILSELKWYRHQFPECCDDIGSVVECYHNNNYFGMIHLGDYTVQWYYHNGQEHSCWKMRVQS